MYKGFKSIRNERAALERDRVLISSSILESEVDDLIDALDEVDIFESVTDEDIEKAIRDLPELDEDDEQLDRILRSETDLDIDDIFGIDKDYDDDDFDDY